MKLFLNFPGYQTAGFHADHRSLPMYQRHGSLQLWQFLVALLDDPANHSYVAWTGRGLEFKLIEPEQLSIGWLVGRLGGWLGGLVCGWVHIPSDIYKMVGTVGTHPTYTANI